MTIIRVDGPVGSGKTALVDTLMEALPYAKLRYIEGDLSVEEFTIAIEADKATDALFPLITIWHRSWVSSWVSNKLTTRTADHLDVLLRETRGFGVILLGDEDIVDEDERELFEDYILGGIDDTWILVEEKDSETLVSKIRQRIQA